VCITGRTIRSPERSLEHGAYAERPLYEASEARHAAYKDAVLIARLTARLRCYRPEPANATWARLRQLGIRRARLVRDLPVG
jgi:hypothetical protein